MSPRAAAPAPAAARPPPRRAARPRRTPTGTRAAPRTAATATAPRSRSPRMYVGFSWITVRFPLLLPPQDFPPHAPQPRLSSPFLPPLARLPPSPSRGTPGEMQGAPPQHPSTGCPLSLGEPAHHLGAGIGAANRSSPPEKATRRSADVTSHPRDDGLAGQRRLPGAPPGSAPPWERIEPRELKKKWVKLENSRFPASPNPPQHQGANTGAQDPSTFGDRGLARVGFGGGLVLGAQTLGTQGPP